MLADGSFWSNRRVLEKWLPLGVRGISQLTDPICRSLLRRQRWEARTVELAPLVKG